MELKKKYTNLIKNKAFELGLSDCKISKVDAFDFNVKNNYNNWINKDFHSGMDYMNRNTEKRFDVSKLINSSKSVITVALNYYPEKKQNNNSYKISKYAYGDDYHIILKNKLYELFNYINENISKISGRVFVDSAPVLEKQWAAKSGIGWQGKNSCIISKKYGSFIFLGEIIIDLELEYDKPINEYCGTCTKCIDFCPTGAIEEAYVINSNKCISYLTIEHRNDFDSDVNFDFNNFIFGCDICQDVCPWNSKPIFTKINEFKISDTLKDYTKKDWEDLDDNKFNDLFKNSPIKRTKLEGIKRNIKYCNSK